MMSAIKNVVFDIELDIEEGKLTFAQIADKYNVTVLFVTMVFGDMMEREYDLAT